MSAVLCTIDYKRRSPFVKEFECFQVGVVCRTWISVTKSVSSPGKTSHLFLRWQPVQCFSCNNWQSPTSAHFCTGKHLQGCPRQRGVWKGAKSNSDCVFFSVVPGRFLNTYRVYSLQSMLWQDAYVYVYVNIYIRYTSYLHVYAYAYVNWYAYVCVYIYRGIRIYLYINMYTCLWRRIWIKSIDTYYIYICVYTCMCALRYNRCA